MERTIKTFRHDGLVPAALCASPIHLIGCGGVGSHVAMMLAKIQVGEAGMHLYDHDTIEAHNPPNQAYERHHIGREKVQALAEQIVTWSDEQVAVTPQVVRVKERLPLSGVVFLCLDTMEDRKLIMEDSIFGNEHLDLVVETRMDARFAYASIFDPKVHAHCTLWREGWYPSSAAESMVGCGGHLSVITAVTQTAILAVQGAMNYYDEDLRMNHLELNLQSWKMKARRWPTMLDE